MLMEETALPPISDEHQLLLRKLTTRLNDKFQVDEKLQAENDVERDLSQLIVLKNREESEEVYGIHFIVTCFLHPLLSELHLVYL